MTSYNNMIVQNKKKQEELKNQQIVLKEQEEKLNVELAKLGEKMTTLSDTSISLADDIKLQKEIVKVYEDLGCKRNEDISTCGRSKLPPGTSFLRPLVRGHVNSEWGSRWGGFHEGIDMTVSPNGNVPVYASGSGLVAAIRVKQPCGGNMVLIHHNINGKTYTSMYAHLRSITVSKGQRVTQNTQVGIMGGNPSTEYWDSCSTGPHMHFTISTGLYGNDYTSWDTLIKRSINPRSVCNFPALGVTFKDRSTRY
ncbi:MAG: peptidoglycan DD-metalloendopeptidase family protein [Firmicutes bacterium]|nr:peptidoglycan DD-metalloendopeptidase family protein [Bacillota bacterium]